MASGPNPEADALTRYVLVFETPAAQVGIEQRIRAHENLVRRLARRIVQEEP